MTEIRATAPPIRLKTLEFLRAPKARNQCEGLMFTVSVTSRDSAPSALSNLNPRSTQDVALGFSLFAPLPLTPFLPQFLASERRNVYSPRLTCRPSSVGAERFSVALLRSAGNNTTGWSYKTFGLRSRAITLTYFFPRLITNHRMMQTMMTTMAPMVNPFMGASSPLG